MDIPKVHLVTKDRRTYHVFCKQIYDFFEDSIQIVDDHEGVQDHQVNLILVSSYQLIKGRNFPSDKLLVARRAVNIAKLEELVSLPAGTKCLVVNNMLETTLETIELLNNLGLDLEIYPYYPGIENPTRGIEVAIIPAGVELVPKGVKQVIDIGIRPIDFSTIVELAVRLNLRLEKANIYSARYIKEIIGLSRRLSNTLNHVNELNHQLDAILNTVHDGIIATDRKGNVLQVNKAAQKIMGINLLNEDVIGKSAEEVFPKLKIEGDQDSNYRENMLHSINGTHLVINKTPIEIGGDKIGVVTAFQDVTRIQKLEQDLRKELQTKGHSSQYSIKDIVGKSASIQGTLQIIKKLAKADRTVLILGENGTGKELFAHSIHELSSRKNGPFLPVNLASLPETLAESELFGYEDGAFTGAKKGGKPGLFELAHNGTIFLDEIGDASPHLQVLLLRVLQEKQVMRVGGHRVIPINVRVIAATNRNLKELVSQGKFREDLYYRLFVLPLRIPSLRERREDIPILVDHFIKAYCLFKIEVSQEVINQLMEYNWPGNVRELESVVQYMTSVMEGNKVMVGDLPEQFKEPAHKSDYAIAETIRTLEKEGDLSDFYIILSCLEQGKSERKSIGRGSIVQYSKIKGIPLTDQQVRHRMEILNELELLHSGTRGQGSRITPNGLVVLECLRNRLREIILA